uniref:Uncharacterized protein n=1 Tax=Helianthus annuus TaxID=4232 RepID=A0A251UB66_HELAN
MGIPARDQLQSLGISFSAVTSSTAKDRQLPESKSALLRQPQTGKVSRKSSKV